MKMHPQSPAPWRICVLVAAAGALLATVPAAAAARVAERIPGRYIVVYTDDVRGSDRATDNRERAHGFRARHRYRSAVRGFAASLNDRQLNALRNDPKVKFVAPDRPVRASAALATGDSAPAGVRRITAATSTTHGASGAAVAVIDTGIDLQHPDLAGHVAGGVNCIDSTRSPQDDHGHGTHVAGTVAAANNGSGVVGVAPGTKLYAVKVLDYRGSGSTSTVICGIDWVTRNAAATGIRVANMSLGGAGDPVKSCSETTDPQHVAICHSTAAGVVYAVAAGNSGWDFDYTWQPDLPAAYPEVVTVAAMADTDGEPGAAGSSCENQGDDRYAGFSNYAATTAGQAHTIAAPGVCVASARLGGGSISMSGTSMASPHVAGAVALCIAEGATSGPCAGLAANQPAAIIDALTANQTDATYGYTGDPHRPVSGRYYGHLTWSPLAATATDGDTTAPAAPTGLTASAGDAAAALDWADNGETDLAGYEVQRATTSGGPYSTVARVGGSAYTDTGLTNGTTYHYVVVAVDTSGNVSQRSSEVSASPAGSAVAITLSASGFKHKGWQYADLRWSGNSTAAYVDVYRDGVKVADRTANDGAHRDRIAKGGSGTYTYRVCEAGNTTTCSNEVQVTIS